MMNAIQAALAGFDRQRHALLPTPVHEVMALSQMSECRVFCKRDDLTGTGFGGNKARKLDFLIADALRSGCDTLLAVGATQSNFCRMAAAYGSMNGMDVHLVLGGKKPRIPTGNLRLDHMLGACCRHIDSDDAEDLENEAAALEASLKRKGRIVYRMPAGGSTAIGALGYVEAMSEILDDEKRLGLHFSTVVFATASAGTQAGLVAGKALGGWAGRVLGICVSRDSRQQEERVFELARKAAALLGTAVEKRMVYTDDSFLGEGYAKPTPECENALHFFARKCGLFLDRVYTGKAAAGLMKYLSEGRFEPGSAVLFIHTGGNIELFA